MAKFSPGDRVTVLSSRENMKWPKMGPFKGESGTVDGYCHGGARLHVILDNKDLGPFRKTGRKCFEEDDLELEIKPSPEWDEYDQEEEQPEAAQ